MFAILGLMSIAMAAIMFTGNDPAEEEEQAASDLLSDSSQSLETVSIDSVIENDAQRITGTGGNDLITGGDSVNVIGGDTGADSIFGNGGDDWIHGGDDNDLIDGGAGDDEVLGAAGDDTVRGGAGADIVKGYIGDDLLFGDGGADTLVGGDGDDVLFGGDGDDMLSGSLGDDTMSGGEGADTLFGGMGNNHIIGNDDQTGDYLNGSIGDDLIRGGVGDYMTGGGGQDTFAIDTDAGATVTDYDPQDDVIELHYNRSDGPPDISVYPTMQGSELHANGQLVAAFTNGQVIDIGLVRLVADNTA